MTGNAHQDQCIALFQKKKKKKNTSDMQQREVCREREERLAPPPPGHIEKKSSVGIINAPSKRARNDRTSRYRCPFYHMMGDEKPHARLFASNLSLNLIETTRAKYHLMSRNDGRPEKFHSLTDEFLLLPHSLPILQNNLTHDNRTSHSFLSFLSL